MNFRTHLLAVFTILTALYALSKADFFQKTTQEKTSIKQESPYKITIKSASWGANCRLSSLDAGKNQKTDQTDNVLKIITRICGDKETCFIPVNPNSLGGDPWPTCGYKKIKIEYRCFNRDSLRTAESEDGAINIDCNILLNKQQNNQRAENADKQ